MTAVERHQAAVAEGEAWTRSLGISRSLVLLHGLKERLAALGVHAEIREHLMGLIVFGPAPALPLYVSVSDGGRFFAWQSDDGRHRVDDLTGAARRLSASVRNGITGAVMHPSAIHAQTMPTTFEHGQPVETGGRLVNGDVAGALRVMTSQSSWKCERSYPARPDQVHLARDFVAHILRDCPKAADAVSICSELCTNAIAHSNSSKPGGYFIVRTEVHEGDYIWIEVEDQGGLWVERGRDDEHGRGLEIVAALADDWDIEGDDLARVVSARLDWTDA